LCTASHHFKNCGHDCLGHRVSRGAVTNRCLGKRQVRHYAPRSFHTDQILPRVCWWGKRYWPHLRVHCLFRGRPEGHCWYPVDRVPPCTRLKSNPMAPNSTPGREGLWCHQVSCGSRPAFRCGRAQASPRVPWHQARHPAGMVFGIAMCPHGSGPGAR
jgi:hypothetical protein